MVKYTEQSTKAFPQYQLNAIMPKSDPIFLPIALVTGLNVEASILRRVRETGDPLVLRMVVDVYGLVQLDATFGLPIDALSETPSEEYPSRKAFETGVHAIWALRLSGARTASGSWTRVHRDTENIEDDGVDFWARVQLLEKIGAIYFEPWVFDSDADDAEPLFPVSLENSLSRRIDSDAADLTEIMLAAVEALSEGRIYLLDSYADDLLVPLTTHRQMPSIRGVARIRIEADTPGRRFSYQKRKSQIETYYYGYSEIIGGAERGIFNKPVNTSGPK
jgi:hypothetical protein